MLQAQHIRAIRIDPARYAEHQAAVPRASNEGLRKIAALGHATLAQILGISAHKFAEQLPDAQKLGVAYVVRANGKNLGISTVTSVIKEGDLLSKNVIIPEHMFQTRKDLIKHYILGIFIRGGVADGSELSVELPGWTDIQQAQHLKTVTRPATFKTTYPVVVVPCSRLQPMTTMITDMQKAAGKQ